MFFDVVSTDQRIGSLVQMMGDSLVHSLINEVSLRVMEDPEALEAAFTPTIFKPNNKQYLNPKTDLEYIQQLDANAVDINDADFLQNIDLNLKWQETENDNTFPSTQEDEVEQARIQTARKLREKQIQQMTAKKNLLHSPTPPTSTSKPFIPTSREFLPPDDDIPPKTEEKAKKIPRNIPIFTWSNLPPLPPSSVHYRYNYLVNFIQDLCKQFVSFHNLETRHEINILSITESDGSRLLLQPKLEFLDPDERLDEENIEEISLLLKVKKIRNNELQVEGWIDSEQEVDVSLRQTMEHMIIDKLKPLIVGLDIAALDIFDDDEEDDSRQQQQQPAKDDKKSDYIDYGFEVIKPPSKPTSSFASIPSSAAPAAPDVAQTTKTAAKATDTIAQQQQAATTAASSAQSTPANTIKPSPLINKDEEELIPMANSNDEFIQSRNYLLQQQSKLTSTASNTFNTQKVDFQEFDNQLSEQQKNEFLSEANEQLQEMLKNSRRDGSGFLNVLQSLAEEDAEDSGGVNEDVANKVDSKVEVVSPSSNSKSLPHDDKKTQKKLSSLFQAGRDLSQLNLQALLDRPSSNDYQQTLDQLRSSTVTTFPVEFATQKLSLDDEHETEQASLSQTTTERYITPTTKQAVSTKAIDENDEFKLYMLLQELKSTSPDLHPMILDGFRDLLLSDSFLPMIQRVTGNFNSDEDAEESVINETIQSKGLYARMVEKALLLHKEVEVLASEESVRHLDTIHQICSVAIDFQQDEMKFLDHMDELRDRFDADLLLFIHHAIDQEQQDLLHKQQETEGMQVVTQAEEQTGENGEKTSVWLQVLTIMKQGVTAELQTRFEDLFEPLSMLVRIHNINLRRMLFERFVNVTATADLSHMKQLAINMAEVTLAQESPDIIKMLQESPKLLDTMTQFRQEIDEFLSDDIIETRLEDLKFEAAQQDLEVVLRHRNPVVRMRMAQKDKEAIEAIKRGGMSLAGGLMMAGVNPSSRKPSSDDGVHNTKVLDSSSSIEKDHEEE